MDRFDVPDRESRFEDACKLAVAVVVAGLIVVAGEAAMQRTPPLGEAAMPAAAASDVVPRASMPRYVPEPGEPEERAQAF